MPLRFQRHPPQLLRWRHLRRNSDNTKSFHFIRLSFSPATTSLTVRTDTNFSDKKQGISVIPLHHIRGACVSTDLVASSLPLSHSPSLHLSLSRSRSPSLGLSLGINGCWHVNLIPSQVWHLSETLCNENPTGWALTEHVKAQKKQVLTPLWKKAEGFSLLDAHRQEVPSSSLGVVVSLSGALFHSSPL